MLRNIIMLGRFCCRSVLLVFLIGFVSQWTVAAPITKAFAVKNNDVHYHITVQVDPIKGTLEGKSIITVQRPKELKLMLGSAFEVTKAHFNDGELGIGRQQADQPHVWHIPFIFSPHHQFEIHWQGSLTQLGGSNPEQLTKFGGKQTTFLQDASLWYPRVVGEFASYKLELVLPPGQRGLVPGRIVHEQDSLLGYQATFEFLYSAEGISLVAGPYEINTQTYQGSKGHPIQLRTYFHQQITHFSQDYLALVKRYLSLYESRIGAYPYTEFSVVSNLEAINFSLPTLACLGIDVLKLPLNRGDISIAREVLRNWWGNGVYSEHRQGNWVEGLITLMADHAIKEQLSAEQARNTRLTWIHDLALLSTKQDASLNTFVPGTHDIEESAEKYKAAMFFLMLQDYLGEAIFQKAIQALWTTRRFQVTSWQQLQQLFEIISGQKLENFFNQWIHRNGRPDISIQEVKGVSKSSDAYGLTLTLQQTNPIYQLRVPISIQSQFDTELQWIDLTQEQQTVTLTSLSKPLFVMLDPDFRLLRKLAGGEVPLNLYAVMSNPLTRTILLSRQTDVRELATVLAIRLQKYAPRIVTATQELSVGPMLVVGLQSEIENFIAAHKISPLSDEIKTGSTTQAWITRLSNDTPIVLIAAQDQESLSTLISQLPHYEKNSYVTFARQQAINNGLWPTEIPKIKIQW
ncbi:MAG: M1 family peptidase [Nitrosomonas sp.]